MDQGLSIKQAAQQTGLTEDAIRHYEKIGLISPPSRKPNGHRVYYSKDIERMELIQCLKQTNMSLEEMKVYLTFPFREAIKSVPELNAKLQEYRKKITDQIADLERILKFIDHKVVHNQSLLRDKSGDEA
ncbi:MerR family transcriptional regulator [Paenibacillus sp. P96]|uniref:MerR family transcriptional regulator n=1 Tax=Paenibacillus zeirhizosphaerae TaxID=2987519 RepID=A0ABT9FR72_9BACL|nr:MerR family transcriptional regulator [Paenibacillus sp. P96]MDP4097231.1 MerR family transcriptional regulator [Paenibacillus sp. P96]